MKYYKRNLGDYAGATRHLSMLEHGAYSLLLDTYYVTEQPLPLESRSLYRLVGARSKDEREAVDAVLQDFFVKREDGWHQDRCDAEIAHKQELSAINKETGKKGGRPKKKSDQEAIDNRNGFETETETDKKIKPIQETRDKRQKTPPKPPEGFAEFYDRYPRKVARAEAEKAWTKLAPDEPLRGRIMAALEHNGFDYREEGRFIPHPATWLNQARWDDGGLELEQAGAGDWTAGAI